MMKNQLLLTLSLASALVAGCAAQPYQPYAREVAKKPRQGGTIALRLEHRPEDRQRADFLMSANCGSDGVAEVAQEGEVVVGQKTSTSGVKDSDQRPKEEGLRIGSFTFGGAPGGPQERRQTSQVVTNEKEWQIVYECKRTAPLAPAKKRN
jgi:hypothetical protein